MTVDVRNLKRKQKMSKENNSKEINSFK